MLATVEDQKRVPTEGRLEEAVRLTGAQLLRVTGENLADRRRVGEDHDRREPSHAEGEGFAVAALALLEQPDGSPGPLENLAQLRLRRTRGRPFERMAMKRPTASGRPQQRD